MTVAITNSPSCRYCTVVSARNFNICSPPFLEYSYDQLTPFAVGNWSDFAIAIRG